MRSLAKLAALGVLGAACAVLPEPAHAATDLWDHNGSTMVLEKNGTKRKLVYAEPRSNLSAAGVKKGTVLFDGEEKTDGRMAGYAKLFRAGCPPVDYFVEGTLDPAKNEILLQGQAPVYAGEGCKITGYSDDNGASSLSFQGRGTAYAAREEDVQSDPRAYPPQDNGSAYAPRSTQPGGDGAIYGERQGDPLYGERYGRRDPRELLGPEEDADPRDPAYGRGPAGAERDYADRLNRYRPYGQGGTPSIRPDPANPDEDDAYADEDEEDEPGYVPYQPFWRWGN